MNYQILNQLAETEQEARRQRRNRKIGAVLRPLGKGIRAVYNATAKPAVDAAAEKVRELPLRTWAGTIAGAMAAGPIGAVAGAALAHNYREIGQGISESIEAISEAAQYEELDNTARYSPVETKGRGEDFERYQTELGQKSIEKEIKDEKENRDKAGGRIKNWAYKVPFVEGACNLLNKVSYINIQQPNKTAYQNAVKKLRDVRQEKDTLRKNYNVPHGSVRALRTVGDAVLRNPLGRIQNIGTNRRKWNRLEELAGQVSQKEGKVITPENIYGLEEKAKEAVRREEVYTSTVDQFNQYGSNLAMLNWKIRTGSKNLLTIPEKELKLIREMGEAQMSGAMTLTQMKHPEYLMQMDLQLMKDIQDACLTREI